MYPFNFYRFGVVCVFVFFCFEDVSSDVEQLGCYEDQGQNRLLGEVKEDNGHLTPAVCIDICSKRGYPFAGTQYSQECFCGYNRPPEMARRPDTECSSPCSGNPKEKCGGAYRLSVYKTTVTAVGALPNGFLLGCFKETEGVNTTRLLPEFRQDFDTMTPKLCFELCFKKGYKLSGVQYGKECYCSNKKLDMNRKTDDNECNMPCAGDNGKFCGGGWRISVYSTGLTDIPSNGRLIGCYEDSNDVRALDKYKTDLRETNSPRTCLNLCYQMGYQYGGVQYEFECFCGVKRPLQNKVKPDDNCNSKCPGDPSETCGGNWRIQIYRTPLTDKITSTTSPRQPIQTKEPVQPTTTRRPCSPSVTIANGKQACKNQLIFFDDFSKIDENRWAHEVKIAQKPDYEFTVYDARPENSFVKDGAFQIKPTVLEENFVLDGQINLSGCTGDAYDNECSQDTSFLILPPVQSARITTKQKFDFKYGIVEIQAKFPKGDWIIGELGLLPVNNTYGSYYESGKIRFASRGNANLKYKDKREMGCETAEGSVIIGYQKVAKSRSVYYNNAGCWRDTFHNFTIIWSQDDISFLVDGRKKQNIMQNVIGKKLHDVVGLKSNIWNEGSPIAPFDQPFYISLGLSVGGIQDFADNSTSGSYEKPWSNTQPRAALGFWNQRNQWLPTWQEENTTFMIKSIKVTAL